jgi:hypothetical protein
MYKVNSLSNLKNPSYQYPPVTEAIIEVRVKHTLKDKDVDKISKKLQIKYPNDSVVTNNRIIRGFNVQGF